MKTIYRVGTEEYTMNVNRKSAWYQFEHRYNEDRFPDNDYTFFETEEEAKAYMDTIKPIIDVCSNMFGKGVTVTTATIEEVRLDEYGEIEDVIWSGGDDVTTEELMEAAYPQSDDDEDYEDDEVYEDETEAEKPGPVKWANKSSWYCATQTEYTAYIPDEASEDDIEKILTDMWFRGRQNREDWEFPTAQEAEAFADSFELQPPTVLKKADHTVIHAQAIETWPLCKKGGLPDYRRTRRCTPKDELYSAYAKQASLRELMKKRSEDEDE